MKTIYSAIILLIFISCMKNNKIIIKDITKNQLINIESTNETPSVLKIKLQGNIDDTCKIQGQKIDPKNLNKEYFFDSYSKKTQIKYESYKAKKGNLIINYSYN